MHMENDPYSVTHEENFDRDNLNVEPLLASLGVEPGPELKRITKKLRDALTDPDTNTESVRLMWVEYSQQFEALAEEADNPEEYAKVQIAAIIHKAFIFRDANSELRYLEELDKAEMYSANSGFTALSSLISAEVDSLTPELDESPERLILQLRGKVSDANRAQMWDLWADEQDYEDLVNHAFEMLLEDGENPQEILSELGILDA